MYISLLIPFQLKNVPKIGGGPESMFFRAPGFPGFPPAPIPGGPAAPPHRLPTSSAAAAAPSLGIPQPPPPGAAPLPPSVDPLRGSHPPSTIASATPASSATSTATSNGPKVRLFSVFKSFLFPNLNSFYFTTCFIFPFCRNPANGMQCTFGLLGRSTTTSRSKSRTKEEQNPLQSLQLCHLVYLLLLRPSLQQLQPIQPTGKVSLAIENSSAQQTARCYFKGASKGGHYSSSVDFWSSDVKEHPFSSNFASFCCYLLQCIHSERTKRSQA